jgi:hypothetical protein
MEYAEQALLSRRSGAEAQALELFRVAFEKEAAAAAFFEDEFRAEPTRSVLYRSAAALALDHGDHRAAERLLATALVGAPPEAVANEIRDLLEMVHFQRHWELRGIRLRPDEFQFSIDGFGTGFGIAPADQFVGRVNDIETMIYRTAERKLKQPYRDSGPRKRSLGDLRLFVSVPRAASFAVTLRIGATDQLELPDMPGTDFPSEVVREVLDCIDLVNRRDLESLEARIGDESYFRNFVGLAQKIAPDGEVVRAVGFTTTAGGVERRVALTVPKAKIQPPLRTLPELVASAVEAVVEIQGTLLEADATDERLGRIQLKTSDGHIETITVPRGMMRDIVKPLFEEEVIVTGIRSRGAIELRSVRRADE